MSEASEVSDRLTLLILLALSALLTLLTIHVYVMSEVSDRLTLLTFLTLHARVHRIARTNNHARARAVEHQHVDTRTCTHRGTPHAPWMHQSVHATW